MSKVEVFGAKIITQTAKCLELQTFASGGGLRLSCDEFADSRFFAMDMVLLENHIQPFTLLFREKETPLSAPEDVCVMSSIQPQLPVTWVLDFHLLNLQNLAPNSAPGHQKITVHGKHTHIRNMGTAILRIKESFHSIHIRLSNMRLLDKAPHNVRPSMESLDEMG